MAGSARGKPGASAVRGPEAVSSVIGTVLMLGITVVVFTAVAITVLAYLHSQPHAPRSDVAVVSGTNSLLLTNRGGESIPVAGAIVVVNVAGVEKQVALSSFPSASSLGDTWNLGESICVQGAASTCKYDAAADVRGAYLVASGFLLLEQGTRGAADQCPSDASAPTASSWTQTPSDLDSSSMGSVTVTVTLADDCYGVDTSRQPSLWYRVNDGSNPPYVSAGGMTLSGGTTFQADIPDQGWFGNRGSTLEYCIGGQKDLWINVAPSPPPCASTRSDVITNLCGSDTSPPTVSGWTQAPTDVKITTNGAITVTATLADNCYGVNTVVNPTLSYRINDGSNPAYTTVGSMTRTTGSTWQGTIPSQSWGSLGGKTLQYYLNGQKDLGGNTQSAVAGVQSDLIDTIPPAFAASNTPTTGTVSNFANAQSSTDSSAVATLTEGPTGTSGTDVYAATATVSSTSWTNPGNGFASDNLYASATTSTATLEYSLADPTGNPGKITQVLLRAEVSITPFSNDGFDLRACLGATCSTQSGRLVGAANDLTIQYDVTALRPGGGSWTWADVTGLSIRVVTDKNGGIDGTWRVDQVWVAVTHVPTYSLSVQMDFSGVASGNTYTLGLNYKTTVDTYAVQVWDGTTWTTRGTTLNAAGLTQWSYVLTANEYNGGAPRVRFVDSTPTSTSQGTLSLDYVRVVTT